MRRIFTTATVTTVAGSTVVNPAGHQSSQLALHTTSGDSNLSEAAYRLIGQFAVGSNTYRVMQSMGAPRILVLTVNDELVQGLFHLTGTQVDHLNNDPGVQQLLLNAMPALV